MHPGDLLHLRTRIFFYRIDPGPEHYYTVLQLALRSEPDVIVSRIPWGVVLLIGGLLTYVGLMQHLGAFEQLNEMLQVHGSPALSLLVLCYIAGITSFAASSIAVFVTVVPLLPALVADGLSPVGGVLALALASGLVDIDPLGITGGLLGAAEPSARQCLFRQLLTYGIVSIVVAPLLAWLAFSWWWASGPVGRHPLWSPAVVDLTAPFAVDDRSQAAPGPRTEIFQPRTSGSATTAARVRGGIEGNRRWHLHRPVARAGGRPPRSPRPG